MKALSPWNSSPLSTGNGRLPLDETAPFLSFHREMDQILDQAFNGFGFTRGHRMGPAVQVQERDKEYIVSVDLPGVAIQDVDLRFSEGMLTLKAERKANENDALYSDRWSGTFERIIGVGHDVDERGIRATLKNGVLAVTLPKSPDQQPRRIQIE